MQRIPKALLRTAVLCSLIAGTALPAAAGVWPKSSEHPVTALDHPTIEARVEQLGFQLENGYRFVTYGDQRALADGEWQALIQDVTTLDQPAASAQPVAARPPLLFLLDTGDIVKDGNHSDQFLVVRDILAPVADLPYLVAVGNHEVDNNRVGPARANVAAFLDYNDPSLSVDRFYFRKDVGPVRFLFLDTNDLVYGDPTGKKDPREPRLGARAPAQLAWLVAQLAEERPSALTTIVVMHHPFLQSSKKHREQARFLWNLEFDGRRLPDILADGGVDLVLTGHTHTFERFTLERRRDGRRMSLVNLSGRPRNAFLFFGAGRRRARDLRGKENERLQDEGFDVSGWQITQDEAMLHDERDQLAVFTVKEDGGVTMQVRYVPKKGPAREGELVRLR